MLSTSEIEENARIVRESVRDEIDASGETYSELEDNLVNSVIPQTEAGVKALRNDNYPVALANFEAAYYRATELVNLSGWSSENARKNLESDGLPALEQLLNHTKSAKFNADI